MTLGTFKAEALKIENQMPKGIEEYAEYYWGEKYSEVKYGVDNPLSFFDDSCTQWNLNKLGTILDLSVDEEPIPGVHQPFVYVGMRGSSFGWHVEDCELYSVSYLHHGKPKYWLVIPPADGFQFEKVMNATYSDTDASRRCPEYLCHKGTLTSPQFLRKHKIRKLEVRLLSQSYVKGSLQSKKRRKDA